MSISINGCIQRELTTDGEARDQITSFPEAQPPAQTAEKIWSLNQQPSKTISLQQITPFGVMLDMDQLTDVLTAISHPTRRAIIGQLANGPARFLDIAEPFDTALNAVTKHLKMLERAGLIERQKQGREVLISFRGEPLREVAGWVHEYERFWNERLDQFEQHFRDKKKKEKK
jgi:DNA-binding transcriptional ArsR family regulator